MECSERTDGSLDFRRVVGLVGVRVRRREAAEQVLSKIYAAPHVDVDLNTNQETFVNSAIMLSRGFMWEPMNRFVHVAAMIACCLPLSSCIGDKVFTTRQTLTLRVLDNRGSAAMDVVVEAKESWQSFKKARGRLTQGYDRDLWEHLDWYRGISNDDGVVVLEIRSTGMLNDKGTPSDLLSNVEYVVNLSAQRLAEEHEFSIGAGVQSKGNQYVVIVEEVGKPQFIDR